MLSDLAMLLFWFLIVFAFLLLAFIFEQVITKIEKAEEQRKESKRRFELARYESRARANRQITFTNCLMDGVRK